MFAPLINDILLGKICSAVVVEDCLSAYKQESFKNIMKTVRISLLLTPSGIPVRNIQGDSGGPLFHQKDGRYKLLGLTSRGPSCDEEAARTGTYTDVRKHLGWICKHTGACSVA
ncbi:hypothetical protein OESDEN_00477 [Oesophagostomum dentatum]|uniref:Peptidase S1 domain-containing protein n=1 Tax=Oesophagostomum dentatum TaxID=61180 RepID=A0A0B1TTS7_OESDE|nr:hypothetical protein OESDEN_00477 [Oesophagostomum dentatum]